jgi:hypothetical protein
MATGKHAFDGKTTASVLAAVLERNPAPILSVCPLSPAALERVVETCLAKDPEERFQTVHDLKTQLKWIGESGSQTSVSAPRKKFSCAMLGALSLASVIVFVWRALRPAEPIVQPLMRLDVDLGAEVAPNALVVVAISPDGTRLVFHARSPEGRDLLATRPLDESKVTLLNGTEDADQPFFSTDGQ